MRNVDLLKEAGAPLDAPVFLSVECGNFVVISAFPDRKVDWWVGYVIHRVGNSADPMVNTLFQVIDIDTGKVVTVNADVIRGIL